MPKTLLLADDSVVIQKLVGLSFANEDVDLTTTDNGDDAIARARDLKPDLVLADVVMPGKNGYEVCEAIKADPNLRHIPVLLLTGTFEAFDENRARAAGSDGHITKPFEAQALVDRVTDLLARAPEPATLATTAPNLDGPAVTRIRAVSAEDDGFEFFDDGVQDLDVSDALMDEPAVAAPPPLPARPSPLAQKAAPAPASTLPPLGARSTAQPPPVRRHEPAAPMPAAVGARTPDIDELAFDVSSDDADPHEAATTIDFGHDDGAAHGPAPVAALDDLLLDESPAWGGDLQIGAESPADESMTRLAGDIFDDGADDFAAASPRSRADERSLGREASEPARRTSLIMSDGDSSSDSIAFGGASSARAADGMRTMFADDLFGDAQAPPPPARSSAIGDPALDSVEELMGETESESSVADEFDVSSSDLGQSIPAMPPLERQAVPADEYGPEYETETADLDDHESFSVSEGLLVGATRGGDPLAGHREGGAPAGPDLTPMMRDRLHETLERVAWEALSDLSDTVVKQVVEKVESIAWEVIPQMAEAIIKEEIRRMKGETDE